MRKIDFCFRPDISQACIGFADDPHKTIVREDGSLNYCWESDKNQFIDGTIRPCYKRVLDAQEGNLGFRYRLVPRFSHRDTLLSRTQDFGDPKRAFVTTIEDYTGCTFSHTAFAYQTEGLRMDIITFTLTVKEGFGHAYSSVYLQSLGADVDLFCAPDSASGAYALPIDKKRAKAPVAIASPVTDGNNREVTGWILRDRSVWHGCFGIILEGQLPPGSFTNDFARQACEQTTAYWDSLKPFVNAFQIPDPEIMGMLSSCGRNILQAREITDGRHEFHVGPTIYRGLWVVDGYYFNECAYIMGRDKEGFDGLLAILKRLKPDGTIQILTNHDKETAVAVSSIIRLCELENRDDTLRELWPMILRAIRTLRALKAKSNEMDPSYPARGLFPPSFGDGGIYGPEPEYTTPMNVLVGLIDALNAAERLNLEGKEEIKEFYDTLHARLLECMERDSRKTVNGLSYLPLSMDTNRKYKPQAGYQTIARVAFHGLFEPSDPFLQDFLRLVDSIDDEEGIPVESGWRSDQGIYNYASVRYAQIWLLCGHPEKSVDYLYAFANHASPARVWREEQSIRSTHSSEICGDMPHNWASVEFIRMVRNLILLERPEGLLIFPDLPGEWLPTEGNPLFLERTPTKFGKVSILLEKQGTNYFLTFSREKGNQEPAFTRLFWHNTQTEIHEGQIRLQPSTVKETAPLMTEGFIL